MTCEKHVECPECRTREAARERALLEKLEGFAERLDCWGRKVESVDIMNRAIELRALIAEQRGGK
jgi:hypothetical protein